jgi:hypothetical protein
MTVSPPETGRADSGSILRVALLLDKITINAWEAVMLRRVVECGVASVVAIFLYTGRRSNHSTSALFHFYERMDQRVFRYKPDALKRIHVRTVLDGVPVIDLNKQQGGEVVGGSDTSNNRFDVVLHLGESKCPDALLAAARYGVWSYALGDQLRYKGIPQAFWELADDSPVVGTVLRAINSNDDEPRVLTRSYSRTHRLSLNKGRNISLWKSASFVARKLIELSKTGGEEFIQRVERLNRQPSLFSGRSHGRPSIPLMCLLMLRQLWRILSLWVSRKTTIDQWCLAFIRANEVDTSFWRYEKITPSRDRFWADPHVLLQDGRSYVFFEEFIYSKGKGHISVLELFPNGKYSKPQAVLERTHHLSYPFVFSWNGICYMIPESSRNRTIELYECKRFPNEWNLLTVLMENVRAVDTTLLHARGQWWLFTNIAENEGGETTDELFLFSADDFRTNRWTPHPMNPIVSDARHARPAGRIFEWRGELYRLSQDCSVEYGGGVNFHRIVKLSASEYEEQLVHASKPDWNPHTVGLHTYSREGNLAVIDLCMRISRWSRQQRQGQ